jgi:aryl-alcohol dehydrogenase-like predicted oxidoreductase
VDEHPDMIYRALGATGERVSAIGMGGFHLAEHIDERLAVQLVHAAVDRGLTFMDNCWDYNDGDSEMRMGKALGQGYRDRVFLMTKIDGRTKAAAARQLDESLLRLRTDRIDLVQHHEVIRYEDPHRIFAEGGAQEALLEAREAGKVRYIGFTGHKDPHIHLHMLDVAAQNGFRFDAVQMPLNVLDAHYRSFGREVLPRLVAEGVGALGMKPLAAGRIPEAGVATAVECLHYSLSLPASVVITGIDSFELLEQAFEAVRTLAQFGPAEAEALLARTAPAAAGGALEEFKTAAVHDGTALNPAWLGPSGRE